MYALKRMTFKKLPGCEPVYMVYDKRDRLVLTQDGNMRASNSNKWSYTEYNTKNRPVESGEIVLSGSATHAQLIDSMMKSEVLPSGSKTPLQYIQYSNYKITDNITPHAFVATEGYANDYHRLTVSLVTATKTRVLGTDQWITSTVYYDSKCRPVQEITDNLVGGVSYVNTAYDFVSNVTKRQEKHGVNTLEYGYTYDDRNRLLNVTASLNGATPITLKSLEYDEVGRLKKVKLHNNTTSSEYAYNIRSWLTGINGNKFSQSLMYGGYNGNITGMNWNANGNSHGYTFTYDGANRLTDAVHGSNHYTEKVTSYDKNGNIQGLQRYGQTGASTYGLVDNLTYTLNGNQITKVEDAVSTSSYNGGTNFVNGSSTENEYTYDYNGNLTKDSNKGIADISWNSLNLPNVVTFADGSTVTYTYAADGTKLRTLHNINGTTTQTDYTGSVLYENGMPKSWLTEAGYISMDDSKYHYYLQDHQGNNRVVISETGAVEEVNHYYAFGGLFSSDESVQPFKYNGKELDVKKGLNWYDYGARQYDATLGRWFVVDPLVEEYYNWSPFVYCFNNPIKYIDPSGCAASTHTDYLGNVIAVYDDGDLGVYKHNSDKSGTQQLLAENYSSFNTSANGEKMGETYEWDSFINPETGNPIGEIVFGSRKALYEVLKSMGILLLIDNELARLSIYALTASNGEFFDIKHGNPYLGTQFVSGKYVSMRDAGNMLAGMVARSSRLPAKITYTVFGAFQLSQNNRKEMFGHFKEAWKLGKKGSYGETPISHAFQRRGYELNFK